MLKCTLGSVRFRRRDGKLREESDGEELRDTVELVELAKVPVEEVPQLEDKASDLA